LTGEWTGALAGSEGPAAGCTINAMFNPFWAEANSLENVFAAWVSAAHDARFAWERWLASATRDRGDAYARYQVSLDREEQAAVVLAAAVRRTPPRVGGTAGAPAAA
jgi:hypothetical protein